MQRAHSSPSQEIGSASSPLSEHERAQVYAQLERMLANPLFSQSRRYAPFLRYIVEKAILGEDADLKERIIGMAVFGRTADYDSNNDPVVRVTAGEVRRRLAQYYQDAAHVFELRINLFPGSYIPEIDFESSPGNGGKTIPPVADESVRAQAPDNSPISPLEDPRSTPAYRRRRVAWISALIAVAAICGAGFLFRLYGRPTVVDQWWQPALGRRGPVLLCVGMIDDIPLGGTQQIGTEPASTVGEYVRHRNHVGLVDVIALERFASMLSRHDQSYHTVSAGSTTYAELRGGPVILVAGLNNPWTVRITSLLRFHFADVKDSQVNAILDKQNSAAKWMVDFTTPYAQTTHDYAIIARLHNITTDQPIFIAAGLGGNGTAAAAEYLTSEVQIRDLIARLPRNWQQMNIEAVIATDVIGNQPGPPVLVALHAW